MFTPPVVSKLDGPLGDADAAVGDGGANWPGGSFDPRDDIALHLFADAASAALGLVPRPTAMSDMDYIVGSGDGAGAGGAAAVGRCGRPGGGAAAPAPAAAGGGDAGGEGGGGRVTVQGLPLVKPPYGRITAIDLEQGRDRLADRARRDAGQHARTIRRSKA